MIHESTTYTYTFPFGCLARRNLASGEIEAANRVTSLDDQSVIIAHVDCRNFNQSPLAPPTER